MTLHIGQFLKELHHHFQILQGLYLMSTDGALTAQCIELIAYGVDRVEPGIVEGGSSGYIIQGIWEKKGDGQDKDVHGPRIPSRLDRNSASCFPSSDVG